MCRGLLTVTLTWRWNAAARPCPPMATHANPGCGTDCTKHAGTQLHRPNRPEPPRPRHAPAVQAPNPKRPRRAPAPLPGRAGPGAAWEEQGVVHGVYWIQFCIANRQFTRAARRPQRPALPRRGARSEERGARSEERGAGSGERGARRAGEEWALRGVCSRFKFALAVPIQTPCNIATSPRPSHATLAGPHALVAQTSRLRPRPPTRPRPSNPRTLRMSSGSMTMG